MDLNKNVSRMLPASAAPNVASSGPPQRVQGLFIRDDEARGSGAGGALGRKASSGGDKKP
jgi:hypothetical protein